MAKPTNQIFRDLPSNWNLVQLHNLITLGDAHLQTGPFGSNLLASEYKETGTPVVAVKNIQNSRIVLYDDTPRVDNETHIRLSNYEVREGDIIFGRKGAVERCALVTSQEDGWLQGSDCIRLRFMSEAIHPEFISLVFELPEHKKWMIRHSIGSTMPSLNQNILSRISIPLPPLAEQKAIAQILGTWDEAIQVTEALIDALGRRKQGLMQRLLTGEVRFPEFEGEWDEVRLEDEVFFQEGPGLRKWQYRDSGMPFINIRCIQDNSLDLSNVQYIDLDEAMERYQHFFLNSGDFVVSSSGTLGKMAIVSENDLPLMLNTSVIRFRTHDENRFTSEYLYFYLQSTNFYKQIVRQSQGSALANYGPSHLKKVKVQLPSKQEQSGISDILQITDSAVQNMLSYRDKLQEQKRGLMQVLLTGQVRVNIEEE